MASPLSDEAISTNWDALEILAPVARPLHILPPLIIDSVASFPEVQYGRPDGPEAFILIPIRTSPEHWSHCWIRIRRNTNLATLQAWLCDTHLGEYRGELEHEVRAYIAEMRCFEGATISFERLNPVRGRPSGDVCHCAPTTLTLAAFRICGNVSSEVDVRIWRQFWDRLALLLLGNYGSGLQELQWEWKKEEVKEEEVKEEEVKEEEESDLLQAFPRPYSGGGKLSSGATKNWMDQIIQSSDFMLAKGRSAIEELLDRKSKLETLDIQLRQVIEVCTKFNEILHKLRESARTLESMRDMVDDNDMEIPLSVELAALQARGGLAMVKWMYKAISHLEDAFDPWAIQVQTELRQVHKELVARNRDMKEFQDGLAKLGKRET